MERSMFESLQNKAKEIAFFNQFAAADGYHAFTPASNARLIDMFKRLSGLPASARARGSRISVAARVCLPIYCDRPDTIASASTSARA
jgi:hypothetical protein